MQANLGKDGKRIYGIEIGMAGHTGIEIVQTFFFRFSCWQNELCKVNLISLFL